MKKQYPIFFSFFVIGLLTACGTGAAPKTEDPEADVETTVSSVSTEQKSQRFEFDQSHSVLQYDIEGNQIDNENYDPIACGNGTYADSDWIDKSGKCLFPYRTDMANWKDDYERRKATYISGEVITKINSDDLLQIIHEAVFYSRKGAFNPNMYNDAPACIVENQSSASVELFKRNNMGEVVTKHFLATEYPTNGDGNKSADIAAGLIFDECVLASNLAYEELNNAMRDQILEKAISNQEKRTNGSCFDDRTNSPFFAFILYEQQNYGGSKWFDYINEKGNEYKKYLSGDEHDAWFKN